MFNTHVGADIELLSSVAVSEPVALEAAASAITIIPGGITSILSIISPEPAVFGGGPILSSRFGMQELSNELKVEALTSEPVGAVQEHRNNVN